MPRDDLAKRIEALNRKPLKYVPTETDSETGQIGALRRKLQKKTPPSPAPPRTDPEPIAYSRTIPVVSKQPEPWGQPKVRDFGGPVALDEALLEITTDICEGPGYCLLRKPAALLEACSELIHRRFVSLTGHPDGEAVSVIAATCEAERIAPPEVLFMDIETTGLSMTPVFLIGTMECGEGGFHFHQYFARDYSEEAGIISAFSDRLKSTRMLVTFNGKSFDMPFLSVRAAATGVKLGAPSGHFDLLHHARRRYRSELPNCRLQTLEHEICGRLREDDIPGSEIPAAYHDFVRTGDASKIRVILMHNLYDLLTMADLMGRMLWRE